MPLHFLGRHYRDGYYVREIARLLGTGAGSVSETLARLTDAGLVYREEPAYDLPGGDGKPAPP